MITSNFSLKVRSYSQMQRSCSTDVSITYLLQVTQKGTAPQVKINLTLLQYRTAVVGVQTAFRALQPQRSSRPGSQHVMRKPVIWCKIDILSYWYHVNLLIIFFPDLFTWISSDNGMKNY